MCARPVFFSVRCCYDIFWCYERERWAIEITAVCDQFFFLFFCFVCEEVPLQDPDQMIRPLQKLPSSDLCDHAEKMTLEVKLHLRRRHHGNGGRLASALAPHPLTFNSADGIFANDARKTWGEGPSGRRRVTPSRAERRHYGMKMTRKTCFCCVSTVETSQTTVIITGRSPNDSK